jgi:hypothetical protein
MKKQQTKEILHTYASLIEMANQNFSEYHRDDFLNKGGVEIVVRAKFPDNVKEVTRETYDYYQKKFQEQQESQNPQVKVIAKFMLQNMWTFFPVELTEEYKQNVFRFLDKMVTRDPEDSMYLIFRGYRAVSSFAYMGHPSSLYYSKDFYQFLEKHLSLLKQHFEIILPEWVEKTFGWKIERIWKSESLKRPQEEVGQEQNN